MEKKGHLGSKPRNSVLLFNLFFLVTGEVRTLRVPHHGLASKEFSKGPFDEGRSLFSLAWIYGSEDVEAKNHEFLWMSSRRKTCMCSTLRNQHATQNVTSSYACVATNRFCQKNPKNWWKMWSELVPWAKHNGANSSQLAIPFGASLGAKNRRVFKVPYCGGLSWYLLDYFRQVKTRGDSLAPKKLWIIWIC